MMTIVIIGRGRVLIVVTVVVKSVVLLVCCYNVIREFIKNKLKYIIYNIKPVLEHRTPYEYVGCEKGSGI